MADNTCFLVVRMIWALCLFVDLVECQSHKDLDKVQIVLVGATGDLARKYLWQGLFDLYREQRASVIFEFYGGARAEQEIGAKKLQDILNVTVTCDEHDAECENLKNKFIVELCYYRKLVDQEDYIRLYHFMSWFLCYRGVGQIYYLSIPPSSYSQVSKYIEAGEDVVWQRIVYEKPFGNDFDSAIQLAKNLPFTDDQIYHVDHYLCKSGVQNIIDFRLRNRYRYDKLWSNQHIDTIEIVLKETVDCAERTEFYNNYGVIRDVMQNHLTEIMALVAMELPQTNNDEKEFEKLKLAFYSEVRSLTPGSALIGQYKDYRHHLNSDSLTPTFGAVVLFVDNARWEGVPFILVSGKKLDERKSYVRIKFKPRLFENKQLKSEEIVFHIQGDNSENSALIISKTLPVPFVDKKYEISDTLSLGSWENSYSDEMQIYVNSRKESTAYSKLIRDVFYGHKKHFVSTASLLSSWKIWTPVLENTAEIMPRIYDKDMSVLNYKLVGNKLSFADSLPDTEEVELSDRVCYKDKTCTISSKTSSFFNPTSHTSFRGEPLVVGDDLSIIHNLAEKIITTGKESVRLNGIYHLALSGGNSAVPLLQTLAHDYCNFPWHSTHVWMVDERCVPLDSMHSNFNQLHEHLLRHVPIPYNHMHPMPVDLLNELCERSDSGEEIYEKRLNNILPEGKLDFVVLGLGVDGHTASLFPWQRVLNEKHKWVDFTLGGPVETPQRMTMTFPLLNKARTIAVLVLGNGKEEIIKRLEVAEGEIKQYPILGVQPVSGDKTWYINNKYFKG